MRVILTGEYPVGTGESVGGVQAVAAALAREFAKLPDVELHVVAYQPGLEEGSREDDGCTVHCVQANPEGNLLTRGRDDRRRLVNLFSKIRPDVIHANQAGVHALAAFDSGLPTVMTVHGIYHWLSSTLYPAGLKGRIRRALFNRIHVECLRRAKHVIVISPYVWQEVGHLSKAHTYRIDNPVDAVYFEQERRPAANKLLFVGLISPRKGIHYLLEALGRVADARPDVVLDIVGKVADDEYSQRLQGFVEQHGLGERVRWLGTRNRVGLAAEYASAAMLVLPSVEETAPVVISEAMAVGCPVVASNVGGVPDMLCGGVGLLVEPGDVSGLAESIQTVLHDPSLAEGLSARAKEVAVQRFAPWSVAAKTVEVYRAVIEAEGGPA